MKEYVKKLIERLEKIENEKRHETVRMLAERDKSNDIKYIFRDKSLNITEMDIKELLWYAYWRGRMDSISVTALNLKCLLKDGKKLSEAIIDALQ